MKRFAVLALTGGAFAAIAFFLMHARAVESFKREFRAAAPEERRSLFERYYGTLSAEQMAMAIESTNAVCHAKAHDIGKVVYAHTKDIGESFRQCGKACTDGCFHGVLMEALGTEGELNLDAHGHVTLAGLSRKVEEICTAATNQRPGNCAHGIGHAFAYLADYHPDIALPLCEAFPTTPLKYYCAGGIYMELDLNDYQLPCDESLPYPVACWRYKTKHLIERAVSFQDKADRCLQFSGVMRRGCFHGLGFAHIDMVEAHPELLASICRAGSEDDQIVCMEGAIEKLADAHASRAIAACAHINTALRPACERAARERLYALDKPFEPYLKAD